MVPKKVKVTIRGLDPVAYRQLRARAAREGRPIGDVLNAILYQAELREAFPKRGSALDIKPEKWGPGTEHDSERVDEIVYGVPRRKPEASRAPPTFKRPRPRWGEIVDNPMVIFEVEPRRKVSRVKGKAPKR